jgi:hypothetical protein
MSRVQGDTPDFGKYLQAAQAKNIETMSAQELNDVSKKLLQKIHDVGVQALSLSDKNSAPQMLFGV